MSYYENFNYSLVRELKGQNMLNNTFNALKFIILPFLIVFLISQASFALSGYTQKEKDIFKLANNMGNVSYTISDILFNSDKIGEENLKTKISAIKHMLNEEEQIIKTIPFSSNIKIHSSKLFKDMELSFKNNKYDKKQLLIAQKSFYNFSEFAKKDIKRLYGNKTVWLYDLGILNGFTNFSMQSAYENKLLLTNYTNLLEYIPYDIPSSISSAILNITTTKDIQTTPSQVAMLKEATDIVNDYFTEPESYIPPATLKDIVGKWEGRLSDPDGTYHKAKLIISSDLSAQLSVDTMFENMTIKSITLTQSVIGFDIKPFNDEKLLIRFSGRLADSMISGEAVDITGKKGLWQFLKTNSDNYDISNSYEKDINNNINKLTGTWKGKILEENGAISDSTLYLNLIDDSFILIENDDYKKDLKIKGFAVNGQAVKFKIEPKGTNLTINFLGKINEKSMEGNVKATDGTRGYWKLIKVSDENKKPDYLINYNYYTIPKNILNLCDPIINSLDKAVSFVSYDNKNSSDQFILKYKGKIFLPEGDIAQIILNIGSLNSYLLLTIPETKTNMNLNLTDLHINEKSISFKTSLDGTSKTVVEFSGTINKNIITGDAINSIGEKITWKAEKEIENKLINNKKISKIKSKLLGGWTGKATIDKDNSLPLKIDFQENKGLIRIGTNDFTFPAVKVDNRNIAFTAIKEYPRKQILIFNGRMNVADSLSGTLSTPEGLIVRVNLDKTTKPAAFPQKNSPENNAQNPATPAISDEEMYNKQTLETSKKLLESKLIETKKKTEQTSQTQITEKETENQEASKIKTPPLIINETKKELDEPLKISSAEIKPAITIEKLLGKWTGELTSPEKDKSEILIEFKNGVSFIYVDKDGEKMPFQMLDFSLNDNEVSFLLKASPEHDFGIKFKGNLIQGILSGQAIDPRGDIGTWFAKKI